MKEKEQFIEAAENLIRQYERNACAVQRLWNDRAGQRMTAMLEEDMMKMRELVKRIYVMEGSGNDE